MKSTKEVLDHHLQSFGEGLDSILSDYTEESVIMSPQGSYKGMSEIREFFSSMIANFPEGVIEATKITHVMVQANIAYITWEALPWIPMATDTFVINDGKIIYQTFAAYILS